MPHSTAETTLHPNDTVIVSGARTPMGGFLGALADCSATQLAATSIEATLTRASMTADKVDEVIMGNVLSAGLKQGPARQAALMAGLPAATGCTTINKLCGSGMRAVMLAQDQLLAGSAKVVIAGGMESMSNAPYLVPKPRQGLKMGHKSLMDHMFLDGLEDAETGSSMGSFAQTMGDQRGLTRAQMDEFAIRSLERAQQAIQKGWFEAESVPIDLGKKGSITDDEQPGLAKIDKIPKLRPAFAKEGTITAANASSISDGASALLLMQAATAEQLGLTPLAKLTAQASHSQRPAEFTTAPIQAIEKLLSKTGWSAAEVDLFEINEAFAMVTLLAMIDLDLPVEKVNIYGGACALGHPIGSTGSRIILTLIHALKQTGQQKGVAALCIGGGEATAVAVEVV